MLEITGMEIGYIIMKWGTFLLFALLITGVLSIIVWGFLFHKAGEGWWKILIPIYGTYTTYKVANCPWIFGFNLLSGFLLFFVGGMILSIIIAILSLVFSIIFSRRLAEEFGKGGGFAVGLFFLPLIFQMILAFGNARYHHYDGVVPAGTWLCPRCGLINPKTKAFCQRCNMES